MIAADILFPDVNEDEGKEQEWNEWCNGLLKLKSIQDE